MKIFQLAITLLPLLCPIDALGLKASQTPEAKLQAENDALRKKNKHLEAMMQVARTEVQRMDASVQSRKEHNINGGDTTEVLGQEVADLQKKLQNAQADKKQLVQTLRQLLAKNSTKIFKEQADKAVQAKHSLAARCAKEQEVSKAQVKAASAKCEDTNEMAKTLQEQNMDLQKMVHELKAKLDKTEQSDRDLNIDKVNLVATMHSLMRENTEAKNKLQTLAQKEMHEAQELANETAMVANLTRRVPQKLAAKKVTRKVSSSKIAPSHKKHEHSMAYTMASKMQDMNRYIDRANMPTADDNSDDVPVQATPTKSPVKEGDWVVQTKQLDAMQKEEDIFARGRVKQLSAESSHDNADAPHEKGLAGWLGLKVAPVKAVTGAIPKDADGLSPIDALDPDAVKQEKDAQAKKAAVDADDGGDGIANLLAQAKDQLNDMDAAQSAA